MVLNVESGRVRGKGVRYGLHPRYRMYALAEGLRAKRLKSSSSAFVMRLEGGGGGGGGRSDVLDGSWVQLYLGLQCRASVVIAGQNFDIDLVQVMGQNPKPETQKVNPKR